MLKQKKIDEIIKDYEELRSIRKVAAKHELSPITVTKYIKRHKKAPASATQASDPYIYNNINNINNNNINIKDNDNEVIPDIEIINNKDIDYKDNKDIDLYSPNKSIKPDFNSKYIKKLSYVLDLAIKRYQKEYKNVHANYISKDIGIFTDKLLRLTGENNTNPDIKQIIFNNFGNNKDMLELITQIQVSKNKLPGNG